MLRFNLPYITGKEIDYIRQAFESGKLSGGGSFSKKCEQKITELTKASKVLMTTSCTHSLEMAAMLLDIKPGDEVIMPSFTFVSTANAFVLRGAKPVFVDIREDTLNIDEKLIEEKITEKTKAIVPVHYGGVGCEMDSIMKIAKKHNLKLVEDAAQALNAFYKGKALGTFSDIGCISFHDTKNFVSGEGGAILLNEKKYFERAEILREKGTDRSKFFRGEIDKYSWVDIGSSYIPSEILKAFLLAQLENINEIQKKRELAYNYYFENLDPIEGIKLPIVPKHCSQNYHVFYILTEQRDKLMEHLRKHDIQSVFHYLPLHSSPMGKRFGYKEDDLPNTEKLAAMQLRLPLFSSITRQEQDKVIAKISEFK